MSRDVKIVFRVQTVLLQHPLCFGAMGTVFGRTKDYLENVFASRTRSKSTAGDTVLIVAQIVLRREGEIAIGAMVNVMWNAMQTAAVAAGLANGIACQKVQL